ncbi:hypothetical protein SLE2022_294740 [Rubroshorea leprosula]
MIIVIFQLFLATSLHMLPAKGATHLVGDTDGWAPSISSTNWTDSKKFHVGDILVFQYQMDLHNVMQVNSTAYKDCTKDGYIRLFTTGNDSLILSEVGNFWYICGVTDHCEKGQKLGIIVAP